MTAPLRRVLEQDVPAVATAGNDDDTVFGEAPVTGSVTSVAYVPEAAMTGVSTNNRTLSLVNKKQDGTGTTTVAYLTVGAGVNLAAYDEKALTLSANATDLQVVEGDTLQWRSVHNGTGIADPGGVARATFNRSTS